MKLNFKSSQLPSFPQKIAFQNPTELHSSIPVT